MLGLPLEFWLIVAGIIAFAAIGSLRSLTACLNHEIALQDIHARAERLRREYDQRMKEILKDSEVRDEGEVSLPVAKEAMELATHHA